ncbi:unnamed protein product, partial [Phaeothamnion confervicola]
AALEGALSYIDAILLHVPVVGSLASVAIRILLLVIGIKLISRATVMLLRPPFRALSSANDYSPGRHSWTAVPSRLPPYFCNVCSEATIGVGDSTARCEICGCYAHSRCARKALQQGLLCKAVSREDVEAANAATASATAAAALDPDTGGGSLAGGEKAGELVMNHQWVRGNIDQLQPCARCGLFCGSDGLFGLHGYSCAWCRAQVHESCLEQMRSQPCSLGRHSRLILPPTAVMRLGRASKKQLLLNAVKRVIPG